MIDQRAEDLLVSHNISSKSTEELIQDYVRQKIQELGGKNKFYSWYRSVHGLLILGYELSGKGITNSIREIYNAISSPHLPEIGFRMLNWEEQPFDGTLAELKYLRDGFLEEGDAHTYPSQRYNLRRGSNGLLFRLSDRESLSLPRRDEEGFEIFAEHVFPGNRIKAAFAAKFVLNLSDLGILGWEKVVESILEGTEYIDSLARESFKELLNAMFYYSALETFLEEQENLENLRYITKGSSLNFGSQLSPDHRLDGEREIKVTINLGMTNSKHDTIIVIQTIRSLKLEDVNGFLEVLDPSVLSRYLYIKSNVFLLLEYTKFMAAFLVSEASKEAIEKANEAGIHIIKIRGGIEPPIQLKKLNSEKFEAKNFFDPNLFRSSVKIRELHVKV